MMERVLAHSGSLIDNITIFEVREAGRPTFVSPADPEGNIIRCPKWEHKKPE